MCAPAAALAPCRAAAASSALARSLRTTVMATRGNARSRVVGSELPQSSRCRCLKPCGQLAVGLSWPREQSTSTYHVRKLGFDGGFGLFVLIGQTNAQHLLLYATAVQRLPAGPPSARRGCRGCPSLR